MATKEQRQRKPRQQGYEALLQLMLSQLPAMVWTTDTELNITSSMGAGLARVGQKANEVVGMKLFDLLPQNDPDYLPVAAHLRALKGESTSYEQEWRGAIYQTRVEPLRDAKGAIIGCIGLALDISSRKQTEEALRNSEGHLRALLESTENVAVEIDEDGILQNIWTGNLQILPFPKEQMLGRYVGDFFPTQEAASVFFEVLHRVLETGRPENFEFTPRGANSQTRLIGRLGVIEPVERDRKKVCVLVRQDKGGKDVEKRFIESQRRLRAILNNSPNPIFIKDIEGAYLIVNRAFEKSLDITQEKIQGKKDQEVFRPEQAEAFRANDLRVLEAGASIEFEETALHEDGLHTSVVQKFPLRNEQGAIYAIGGIVTDITERKRMLDHLRESEERLRLLVENVRDYAIYMLDPDGRISTWNRGAERINGYSSEEILGKHCSIFYPAEDVQAGKPELELKIAAAEGRLEEEGWHVRKDGSRFWANAVTTALFDAQEKLRGFSKITRDTTEHKTAEDSLRRLSGQILRLQDEERRRLARELHDSTGQTLSALCLNLALISRSAELIQEQKTARVLAESLVLAEQASQDLRTFSYLLHPPLLDETGLAGALRWYIEGFMQRTKIAVELSIFPSTLGRLPRDTEMTLFRVTQEALTNIYRHSGSQTAGIHVEASTDRVALEVWDQGKGWPADNIDINREGLAALGVGVRGMQERVRQLGGSLEIRHENPGTRIIAVLPIQKARDLSGEGPDTV